MTAKPSDPTARTGAPAAGGRQTDCRKARRPFGVISTSPESWFEFGAAARRRNGARAGRARDDGGFRVELLEKPTFLHRRGKPQSSRRWGLASIGSDLLASHAGATCR